jgi:hypothetical protein
VEGVLAATSASEARRARFVSQRPHPSSHSYSSFPLQLVLDAETEPDPHVAAAHAATLDRAAPGAPEDPAAADERQRWTNSSANPTVERVAQARHHARANHAEVTAEAGGEVRRHGHGAHVSVSEHHNHIDGSPGRDETRLCRQVQAIPSNSSDFPTNAGSFSCSRLLVRS